MMGFLAACFGFLEQLIKKLPIQDRKERWKNELDKLKKEQERLLSGAWTKSDARRFARIVERIAVLHGLLENSAND